MSEAAAAVAALESRLERTLAELVELARIPGVSADGFDPAHVKQSAEHVATLLGDAGLRGGVAEGDAVAAHRQVVAWRHVERSAVEAEAR